MPSAFITGGASGIGRALAARLNELGYTLTLLDLNQQELLQTASQLQASGGTVRTAVVNVCDNAAHDAAIKQHVAAYNSLDLVVLNAGIGERTDFLTSPDRSWEVTLDVDLRAVLVGVQSAARAMMQTGKPGSIVSVASAAGIFAVGAGPVYAAAKAGVVHFTRSLAPRLAKHNISLTAVCPQFVDTPLVRNMISKTPDIAKAMMADIGAPLLQPKQVVEVILQLASPASTPGTCMLLLQNGRTLDPFAAKKLPKAQAPAGAAGGSSSSSSSSSRQAGQGPAADSAAQQRQRQLAAAWAQPGSRRSFSKVVVQRLSTDFRSATALVTAQLPAVVPPGQVLIRRTYVGINASDINFTAGRYFGKPSDAAAALPFDAGFESVGVVAAVGEGVSGLAPGACVATMSPGFSEYGLTGAKHVMPVPTATPEMVALLTSGLTASIALEQLGDLKPGKTVLVTAAAGGTGQFAVQLARLAGCHVVATCSSEAKAQLLRSLGAARVINYKTDDVKAVLKKHYPKGVDLVYESVGGDMFDLAVNALATKGRVIVIGMMSQYGEGWPASEHRGLAEKLLWKSASVCGFFLLAYAHCYKRHLAQLAGLVQHGRLQVALDPRRFVGLGSVAEAVEHLHSGCSSGKVVVQIPQELPPLVGARM